MLVGSGNPEEGELRPQLLDRFGLSVEVATPTELAARVEVVRRRDAFERDPAAFTAQWKKEDERTRKRIVAGRARLNDVTIPDAARERAAQLCMALGTDGLHGDLTLIRAAVGQLRQSVGLQGAETLRREGAPIPMKPLPRWDNGRDVVLAGDAAGVVAPASGEGIYYAMVGGELAAQAVAELLRTGDASALKLARRRFMKDHGMVFRVLGIMQWFWYSSDRRRERFVKICEDRDVQQLTFESYMNKKLVRKKPMAHVRIFFKDMAHLLGLARV